MSAPALPVYHSKSCAVFRGAECTCSPVEVKRIFCPNERCPNHTSGWIPRVAKPKKCPTCQKRLTPAPSRSTIPEEVHTLGVGS